MDYMRAYTLKFITYKVEVVWVGSNSTIAKGILSTVIVRIVLHPE